MRIRSAVIALVLFAPQLVGAERFALQTQGPITTVKGHEYQITIAAVDANGNRVDRSVLLRALL